MTKLSIFGVVITLIYLSTLAILGYANWDEFAVLNPNEWGDFLAGTLGPLAIFWLILGFFQQGIELRHSVAALKLQAEELKNSVEQQQAMVRITEEQLNLDIQLRDQENESVAQRSLPFFQVSEDPNKGAPPLGTFEYGTYRLKNLGAHAKRVELVTNSDKGYVNPNHFDNFPQNETREISVNSGHGKFGGGTFTLTCENFSGQKRRQVFSVGMRGTSMTLCFPEYK